MRNVVQDAAPVRILRGLCLAGLEDAESLQSEVAGRRCARNPHALQPRFLSDSWRLEETLFCQAHTTMQHRELPRAQAQRSRAASPPSQPRLSFYLCSAPLTSGFPSASSKHRTSDTVKAVGFCMQGTGVQSRSGFCPSKRSVVSFPCS